MSSNSIPPISPFSSYFGLNLSSSFPLLSTAAQNTSAVALPAIESSTLFSSPPNFPIFQQRMRHNVSKYESELKTIFSSGVPWQQRQERINELCLLIFACKNAQNDSTAESKLHDEFRRGGNPFSTTPFPNLRIQAEAPLSGSFAALFPGRGLPVRSIGLETVPLPQRHQVMPREDLVTSIFPAIPGSFAALFPERGLPVRSIGLETAPLPQRHQVMPREDLVTSIFPAIPVSRPITHSIAGQEPAKKRERDEEKVGPNKRPNNALGKLTRSRTPRDFSPF